MQDESCSIIEELDWKEQRENTMEAEVIMNSTVKYCSLEVSPFLEHTSDCLTGG